MKNVTTRSWKTSQVLEEKSFEAAMAEQLRHAPWLLLSLVIHAIAVMILMLIPASVKPEPSKQVTFAKEEVPEEIVDPKPPEPEIIEPVEPDDVELVDDVVLDQVSDVPAETFSDVPSEIPSAFEATGKNPAIGLGGGAAGGGGGGAHTGTRTTRKPIPAVHRALVWLARHQDENGKWDADDFMKHDISGLRCDGEGNAVHDVGLTGLALLAFLADGNTMRGGEFRDVVRRAVNWLRHQQGEDGLYGTNASSHFIYDHTLATLAMCEAYGLSNYSMLEKYAQRGINYLEKHRNPYMVWRYQPRSNDNDTSITGWAVMAYDTARAFGLQVNERAMEHAAVWFDSITDPTTGRHGYKRRAEASSRHRGDHAARFPANKGEALTAVGLLCRTFLGQDPRKNPVMLRAADLLLAKPPVWNDKDGSIDHYYWYYATYAMYQIGGRRWKRWSKTLGPAVVRTQRRDGNFDGSWDPVGVWGEEGGRVYSTAILALTLAAYYRYTRVFVR